MALIYRTKAKLEVAAKLKVAEFWTLAVNVDTHLLAACECLNGVPEAALTFVAHRYRDDPRRGAQPPASRARAAGGGPARTAVISAADGGSARTSTSAPAYVVIRDCDSDDLEELRKGGAPSDSD